MAIRRTVAVITLFLTFLMMFIPVNGSAETGIHAKNTAKQSELNDTLALSAGIARTADDSFSEKAARFITRPIVITVLLTIGFLGLVLELFSPGFGLAGLLGLSALLLFFYGHMVTGLAGFETLLLFMAGIGLLLLELFVPGGITGMLGLTAIVGSFFLAADNVIQMGISLLVAIGISILASIMMIRVFGKKMKLFNKIVLTDSTNTESGYVSNQNRHELIGLTGYTLTPLRPAGTIVIEEERIDVVSEGEYIAKGTRVKVVKTEGARIVVREIVNLDKK